MPTLDLRRDIGFFMDGATSQKELTQLLAGLQQVVNNLEVGLEYSEFSAFQEAVKTSVSDEKARQQILTKAHFFFDHVKEARELSNGDVVYDVTGTQDTGEDTAGPGEDIYFDYETTPTSVFERLRDDQNVAQHALAYAGLFKSASVYLPLQDTGVERENFLDVVQEILIAQPLTYSELMEAMQVYYSCDLAWMRPEDRVAIISASFDPAVLAEKALKFDSYFGTPAQLKHQKTARSVLEENSDVWDLDRFGLEYTQDLVGLIILIESQGRENAKRADQRGLMQVKEENFKEYGPSEFNGENFNDPRVNIATGSCYFFTYCLGEPRNPDGSISRAIANYNAGAGVLLGYDRGNPLTQTTTEYLQDYLIYSRLLGLKIQ